MKRLCLLLLGTQLAGCAVPFYMQAVSGQLDILRRRVPIEEMLARADTSVELARRLQQVLALRQFAVGTLGLPDNGSYETYVDLGRQNVVWNVVAAEEFSVQPERWCYPFVGCVAYRGYFAQEAADRYAAKLAQRGLDVYVGGSRAYSTLGRFSDPVLSTMLDAGELALAEILIHELAHQQLYIKNDSGLSEAFATTVAEYGTEQWLVATQGPAHAADYRRRLCYRDDFADLIADQQRRLGAIFAQPGSVESKRMAKSDAYATMRADYDRLRLAWGGYAGYDAWMDSLTNNAALAALATYRQWVGALRYELGQAGLTAFYERIADLEGMSTEQRQRQLERWRDAGIQRPACSRNEAN
jgi:predicted aminopeptidase